MAEEEAQDEQKAQIIGIYNNLKASLSCPRVGCQARCSVWQQRCHSVGESITVALLIVVDAKEGERSKNVFGQEFQKE